MIVNIVLIGCLGYITLFAKGVSEYLLKTMAYRGLMQYMCVEIRVAQSAEAQKRRCTKILIVDENLDP